MKLNIKNNLLAIPTNSKTFFIETVDGGKIDILPTYKGKLIGEINDTWVNDILGASASARITNHGKGFYMIKALASGTPSDLSKFEDGSDVSINQSKYSFIQCEYDNYKFFRYFVPMADSVLLNQLTNLREDATTDIAKDTAWYIKHRIANVINLYDEANPGGQVPNISPTLNANIKTEDISSIINNTDLSNRDKGDKLWYLVREFCKKAFLLKTDYTYNIDPKSLTGWIDGEIVDLILDARAYLNFSTAEIDAYRSSLPISGITLRRFDDMPVWFTKKQKVMVFHKSKSFGWDKMDAVPGWFYGTLKLGGRDKQLNYSTSTAFKVIKPYAMSILIDKANTVLKTQKQLKQEAEELANKNSKN